MNNCSTSITFYEHGIMKKFVYVDTLHSLLNNKISQMRASSRDFVMPSLSIEKQRCGPRASSARRCLTTRARSDGYSPVLQPLRASFCETSDGLRDFAKCCVIDRWYPSLTAQMARADKSFGVFCDSANALIKSSGERASFMCSSSMQRTSQTLVDDWTQLITEFNEVVDTGPLPTLNVLISSLTRLNIALYSLSSCLAARSGRRDPAFKDVKAVIIWLRKRAVCALRLPRSFNMDEISRGVSAVESAVGSIIGPLVSRCSMATGEMMRAKIEVGASLKDAAMVVVGMTSFASTANLTRALMASTSGQIDATFHVLKIPIHLYIKFDDEEVREPDGETIMSAIRDRIGGIGKSAP